MSKVKITARYLVSLAEIDSDTNTINCLADTSSELCEKSFGLIKVYINQMEYEEDKSFVFNRDTRIITWRGPIPVQAQAKIQIEYYIYIQGVDEESGIIKVVRKALTTYRNTGVMISDYRTTRFKYFGVISEDPVILTLNYSPFATELRYPNDFSFDSDTRTLIFNNSIEFDYRKPLWLTMPESMHLGTLYEFEDFFYYPSEHKIVFHDTTQLHSSIHVRIPSTWSLWMPWIKESPQLTLADRTLKEDSEFKIDRQLNKIIFLRDICLDANDTIQIQYRQRIWGTMPAPDAVTFEADNGIPGGSTDLKVPYRIEASGTSLRKSTVFQYDMPDVLDDPKYPVELYHWRMNRRYYETFDFSLDREHMLVTMNKPTQFVKNDKLILSFFIKTVRGAQAFSSLTAVNGEDSTVKTFNETYLGTLESSVSPNQGTTAFSFSNDIASNTVTAKLIRLDTSVESRIFTEGIDLSVDRANKTITWIHPLVLNQGDTLQFSLKMNITEPSELVNTILPTNGTLKTATARVVNSTANKGSTVFQYTADIIPDEELYAMHKGFSYYAPFGLKLDPKNKTIMFLRNPNCNNNDQVTFHFSTYNDTGTISPIDSAELYNIPAVYFRTDCNSESDPTFNSKTIQLYEADTNSPLNSLNLTNVFRTIVPDDDTYWGSVGLAPIYFRYSSPEKYRFQSDSPNDVKTSLYISSEKLPGFQIHPAFMTDGNQAAYLEISKSCIRGTLMNPTFRKDAALLPVKLHETEDSAKNILDNIKLGGFRYFRPYNIYHHHLLLILAILEKSTFKLKTNEAKDIFQDFHGIKFLTGTTDTDIWISGLQSTRGQGIIGIFDPLGYETLKDGICSTLFVTTRYSPEMRAQSFDSVALSNGLLLPGSVTRDPNKTSIFPDLIQLDTFGDAYMSGTDDPKFGMFGIQTINKQNRGAKLMRLVRYRKQLPGDEVSSQDFWIKGGVT